MIEQIEKLRSELESLTFTERKTLRNGEIDVHLSRAAKDIAAEETDVGSKGASHCQAIRAGNRLARAHNRSDKGKWIEIVAAGNTAPWVAIRDGVGSR